MNSTHIPGFNAPSAGFEVPLEMLAACHARIEQQLGTLQRLAKHVDAHGADEQARQAAVKLMRYFDTSAVHHHEDEELDLFPALIDSVAASDATCVHELTEGLTADHRVLEGLWRRLRNLLERVAQGERLPLPAELAASFTGLYTRHMKREEDELLPMAARLLSDEELDRIGLAMRVRRGLGSAT